MKIRDRIKSLRRVKAGDLLPNPKNWRTHPADQQEAMRGVLAKIGFADAVLARETPDGLMLIDGHLRAEVAPDSKVPVLILDVDEAEADILLATLDPLCGMALQDTDKLKSLVGDLAGEGISLAEMGYTERSLEDLLDDSWPEAADITGMDSAEGARDEYSAKVEGIAPDDKEDIAGRLQDALEGTGLKVVVY